MNTIKNILVFNKLFPSFKKMSESTIILIKTLIKINQILIKKNKKCVKCQTSSFTQVTESEKSLY